MRRKDPPDVSAARSEDQSLVGLALPMTLDDLDAILFRVTEFLRRYVVFPVSDHAVAIALWVAHTHALAAADVTPYLALTSPEKRSGKTRTLEALELLVPQPLRAASISEAALFRTIDEGGAVLLLDETDAIFSPKTNHEDLRKLINAGYRRGAVVARCEPAGKQIVTRRFEAFCPKVLAGIGDLPDTVADRSIPIRLHRRAPGEEVARFRFREAVIEAQPIREALEMWADSDAVDRLKDAWPDIPEALNDRAADGWEPLFAIADLAGGEWPSLARAAAVALHADDLADEETLGVRLLADIRKVFGDRDRFPSSELARALVDLEEAPWADLWGKPLDARGLARRLRPFSIQPKAIRVGETTPRGYLCEAFTEAWNRYVPQEPGSDRNTATPQVDGGFPPQQLETLLHSNSPSDQGSFGVAVKSPEQGEGQ
jgi:Protein of unknown function (DUF3631)